jgi:hypothetical protein
MCSSCTKTAVSRVHERMGGSKRVHASADLGRKPLRQLRRDLLFRQTLLAYKEAS